ncbi:uncharacterized protein WM277_027867 [Molossus nigricans]
MASGSFAASAFILLKGSHQHVRKPLCAQEEVRQTQSKRLSPTSQDNKPQNKTYLAGTLIFDFIASITFLHYSGDSPPIPAPLEPPDPLSRPGWPPTLPSTPEPGARPTGKRAEEQRGYLSGVGFGLRRLEEGVGQLPEPHGYSLGHVGRLGVHDGVEKRLQVGLRVPSDVHDLVSGRGGLRRRLGPRGCGLPGPGRRALPLWGLRGRLSLALGGRLRRRLLPGIHGFCLPRRAPRPGGRGLRPGAPSRRAQMREAARAAGRAALGGGSDALLALRAGGLRGGPASPAPAPPPPPCAPAPLVWRLRLGRGCERPGPAAPENFFPFTPLTGAGQLVASPLPLSLLLPLLVPSFLPPFLFPGGGCARLRQKLASDAKTKVERTARPSRSPAPPPPGSSFLCAPARTGSGAAAERNFPLQVATFLQTPGPTPLPAARDQLALGPGLRPGFPARPERAREAPDPTTTAESRLGRNSGLGVERGRP